MRRLVRRWELAGVPAIVGAGALLHFAFEWSGGWRPLAVFAPVNESVWEHLKLGFWPGLAYGVIELFRIGEGLNNWWVAKSAGLTIMGLLTSGLFYGYVAVLGEHALPLDIAVFVAAVAAGQLASYRLLIARELPRVARVPAAAWLLALASAFALWSFDPPHVFPFRDPVTGGYGVSAVQ